MIRGQDLNKIENLYDTVAKEYAKTFSGELEKKPKDQEILHRFSQEIGDRRPVWDLGCGPGNTTEYLTNLGVEISGLDLSEGILEQARASHPEIHCCIVPTLCVGTHYADASRPARASGDDGKHPTVSAPVSRAERSRCRRAAA